MIIISFMRPLFKDSIIFVFFGKGILLLVSDVWITPIFQNIP
jgi:hypothetical protein